MEDPKQDPKQNGYQLIHVDYFPDPENRRVTAGIRVWQQVVNGVVTRFVNDEGLEIKLPDVYEARLIYKEFYFAPNVERDPDGYQPPSIAEFQGAMAKGPEAYGVWVQAEWDKKAAIDAARALKG